MSKETVTEAIDRIKREGDALYAGNEVGREIVRISPVHVVAEGGGNFASFWAAIQNLQLPDSISSRNEDILAAALNADDPEDDELSALQKHVIKDAALYDAVTKTMDEDVQPDVIV